MNILDYFKIKKGEKMDLRKGLLWAGIGALGVTTLYTVCLFLFGAFSQLQLKVLFTTFAIGTYCLAGFCSTGFKEKGLDQFIFLTYATVVISLFGAFIAVHLIWTIEFLFKRDFESEIKLELVCLVLAFALAHCSLLFKSLTGNLVVTSLGLGSAMFICITAVMLVNLILNEWDIQSEFYFRFLITSYVLSLGGSLVLPLIKKVIV